MAFAPQQLLIPSSAFTQPHNQSPGGNIMENCAVDRHWTWNRIGSGQSSHHSSSEEGKGWKVSDSPANASCNGLNRFGCASCACCNTTDAGKAPAGIRYQGVPG